MKQFFFNLFSRRKKRIEGKEKDFFSYEIPEKVRNQILITIFENLTHNKGGISLYGGLDEFKLLRQKFLKETGKSSLMNEILAEKDLEKFIRHSSSEELMDFIEFLLAFKIWLYSKGYSNTLSEAETIRKELNRCFLMNKIGYEIIPAMLKDDLPYIIVPVYSKFLHVETIKRPLALLYNANFKGSLLEFERALEKFKDEDYVGSIQEANKSFESVLKSILDMNNIEYDEKKEGTSKKLVEKLIKSDFIDSSLKDAFDRLIKILESGLPTIRNRPGIGHGSGIEPKLIDKSYAEFALHLAGAYIVFLINLYEVSK